MKEQKLLSYLRKCIEEYHLIHENDSITVGLSGGKDSTVLLYALKRIQDFYPIPFELNAVTVDLGLSMDYSLFSEWCEKLNVPYHVEKTQIAEIVFHEKFKESPCSLCSNMRRSALVESAIQMSHRVESAPNGQDFQNPSDCKNNIYSQVSVALGHHRDDYLNTLMLSLLYEGQFYTFAPMTKYPDREVKVIRPLLYVPEAAIKGFAEENKLPVIKNNCPKDHVTKRQEMAELIETLRKTYPDIKDRLMHAVMTSQIPDWVDARKFE